MGIGGLDTEFSEIFRRAFASRVFPPGLVEKLGIQHVKGQLDVVSNLQVDELQAFFFMGLLVPGRLLLLVKLAKC